MGDSPSKAVLITGCSSGIGEATAKRLASHGWSVYASARRLESIEHLADGGCELLQLDVCDESSMRAAVETIEREHGAVGVLVNNAGYSQGGPIEQVPLQDVRRQFETNVFGLIALTQLVLGAMRSQHWGKIVNVGSMGGKLTLPGGGLYHATKYSLEAISDALRFEVRGFGVDVVLIEPGLITTEFGKTAAATVSEAGFGGSAASHAEGAKADAGADRSLPDAGASTNVADAGADMNMAETRASTNVADTEAVTKANTSATEADPYKRFNEKLAAMTLGVYEGPMRHLGGGPDVVAKAIEKAISRRRAPSRMLLTPSARLTVLQRKLLPDRLWDALLRTQMPEPRRAR
jgi:NADP-dependent 3-hydroxy acid dehydrogenase YdfG